jgi:hypothetical protein
MSDSCRYITERLRNKAAVSGTPQSIRSLMEEAVAVIENRDKGIAAAIAAEREACAKIADDHSTWPCTCGAEMVSQIVATEIRKRGT